MVAPPRYFDGVRRLTAVSVSAVRDGDPKTLRRRLAGDVDAIVARALRKEPRERYASAEMAAVFTQEHRYRLWRRIWIHLARSQQELGLPISVNVNVWEDSSSPVLPPKVKVVT